MNSNWSYSPETLNSRKNRHFFVPRDLGICWMTLKNNRAPLLCCFKLCTSFQSHRWIQTGVTVRKRSIRVHIGDILSRVTLKFDGWPWKTIGHPSYAASSFAHHFIAIGEFKLELQSGNAQFGSKLTTFFSRVTLKFDGWPWKTIGHLFWTWPFAWTSLLSMVITPEIFRMIRWQKHCQKGVTDGPTDWRKEVLLEMLGRSWKKNPLVTCSLGCST